MSREQKDAEDYEKEDRQDLVARLMGAQALGNFLLHAFDAMVNFGINFKSMPEWNTAIASWDEAAKLRPHAAQTMIVSSIVTLENALRAAIRRKQFRLTTVPPKG